MRTITTLKTLVALLDRTIEIDSIVDNLNGTYTVNTCNTYHLTGSCLITLDSKQYQIIDLKVNEYIVLKEVVPGSGAPSITTIDVPAPKFFEGPAIDINSEVITITNPRDKFPMVYLFEPFSEVKDEDGQSMVELESSITLFGLDVTNLSDWKHEQYHSLVIGAMDNLFNELVIEMEKASFIGELPTSTRIPRPKFGIVNASTGTVEPLFSDSCGGIEYKIVLPINFSLLCNTNNC